MIFYSKNLIVSTLTTHTQLNNINYFLRQKKNIYNKIYLINKTLKKDFKISDPKIAICGINPHAGEKGNFGKEEGKYIIPVIKTLRKKNIKIDGPFSPDTFFNKINIKKFDCFICTYHDQALIPFKLITNFEGVNYTGSLDIIRTSPTHGTAENIKNIKNANNKSLINAFLLAEKIYINK